MSNVFAPKAPKIDTRAQARALQEQKDFTRRQNEQDALKRDELDKKQAEQQALKRSRRAGRAAFLYNKKNENLSGTLG